MIPEHLNQTAIPDEESSLADLDASLMNIQNRLTMFFTEHDMNTSGLKLDVSLDNDSELDKLLTIKVTQNMLAELTEVLSDDNDISITTRQK